MRAEGNQGRSTGVFVIDVSELADGAKRIDRDIPLGWLGAELAACEYPLTPLSGAVDLVAERSSGGVLVRGRAHVRVETDCGICLARTALDLTPSFGAFLMPRPERVDGLDDGTDDDLELTPEELEREWYVGDRIVLDELIRDGIMLELPMTPRCAGPCAVPVEVIAEPSQTTVDPRLAPLASIKLSKE